MSNKNLAIGTIALLVPLLAFFALFASTYVTLQSINPPAAIAAITVAVIGIVWLKKTAKA